MSKDDKTIRDLERQFCDVPVPASLAPDTVMQKLRQAPPPEAKTNRSAGRWLALAATLVVAVTLTYLVVGVGFRANSKSAESYAQEFGVFDMDPGEAPALPQDDMNSAPASGGALPEDSAEGAPSTADAFQAQGKPETDGETVAETAARQQSGNWWRWALGGAAVLMLAAGIVVLRARRKK